MSFSADLKNELQRELPKSIHCRLALLAGYISINGRVEEYQGDTVLAIRVDSDGIEDYISRLLSICADISRDNLVSQNEKKHHRKLIVTEADDLFT